VLLHPSVIERFAASAPGLSGVHEAARGHRWACAGTYGQAEKVTRRRRHVRVDPARTHRGDDGGEWTCRCADGL